MLVGGDQVRGARIVDVRGAHAVAGGEQRHQLVVAAVLVDHHVPHRAVDVGVDRYHPERLDVPRCPRVPVVVRDIEDPQRVVVGDVGDPGVDVDGLDPALRAPDVPVVHLEELRIRGVRDVHDVHAARSRRDVDRLPAGLPLHLHEGHLVGVEEPLRAVRVGARLGCVAAEEPDVQGIRDVQDVHAGVPEGQEAHAPVILVEVEGLGPVGGQVETARERARVAHAVLVLVLLARVGHIGAVVADIAHAVPVAVLLARVRIGRTVVLVVADAVLVRVEAGAAQGPLQHQDRVGLAHVGVPATVADRDGAVVAQADGGEAPRPVLLGHQGVGVVVVPERLQQIVQVVRVLAGVAAHAGVLVRGVVTVGPGGSRPGPA